ncbi:MAG: LysR substrate-binding domain-containing protein, partial [Acidobacteriota bacterium]
IRVSGNLEANDAGALREAVLAGLGVALLPLWLVGEDIRDGRLEVVLPDYPAPDSAIYAVYAPGRFLSPKVRRFVDFLVEEVTALARTWTAE